jgi:predicted ATP-binding protein involved in virulence
LAFKNSFSPTIDFNASLEWFFIQGADEGQKAFDKNDISYRDPQLQAVRSAVTESLSASGQKYTNIRMLGNLPKLMIQREGFDYEINQLSDGYRTMLALVMDLARRMAMANGHVFEGPRIIKDTPAIILIDEVELHLHPRWQQTVLPTLMDIFENTQFIVTTHSPQILTSIAAKHIKVLRDNRAYSVNDETEGAEAWRIMKDVLGVDSRPADLEIVKDLNEYIRLVYEEKWDSPRAADLQAKLNKHYGPSEPVLKELELHIENSKWEREL